MPFDVSLTLIFLLFVALFIALYFVVRSSTQALFEVFKALFHYDRIVYMLVALIFLPGTIIHELSHFFMALLLFLPVHNISVFPKRVGHDLKLGYVMYEKKDVVRSILVGIAPVIVGMLLFWWLYSIELFASSAWYIQLIKVYCVFVISSTMFTSKQDLVDIQYSIPIVLVVGLALYLFDVNVLQLVENETFVAVSSEFLYSVSTYLLISLLIHLVLIIVSRGIVMIFRFPTNYH